VEQDTLTISRNKSYGVYRKQDVVDTDYMVFGIQTFWDDRKKKGYADDAYLALIPLSTVRSLKQQYADIDSCNGDGAAVARNHVHNVYLYGASTEVKAATRIAFERDKNAQRTGGDRICLHVRGKRLVLDEEASVRLAKENKGDAILNIKPINAETEQVFPEAISVVDCQSGA
jgi:hypothetical protein